MTTNEIIESYYNSLSEKDDRWQELWSDDGSFSDASRVLNATGKEAVVQSFNPFLKGIESVKVKQMIVEGSNACVVVSYIYINPKGEKMNQDVAEVWHVKDGKLVSLVIYFDLTAYRGFMKR